MNTLLAVTFAQQAWTGENILISKNIMLPLHIKNDRHFHTELTSLVFYGSYFNYV